MSTAADLNGGHERYVAAGSNQQGSSTSSESLKAPGLVPLSTAPHQSGISTSQRSSRVQGSRYRSLNRRSGSAPAPTLPPADESLNLTTVQKQGEILRSIHGEGDREGAKVCSPPDESSSVSENGGSPHRKKSTELIVRRPEVLESVYSVEEDTEQQQQSSASTSGILDSQRTEKTSAEKKREGFRNHTERAAQESDDSDTWTYNSSDKLPKEQSPKTQVTVYNRVMSNHRSVIKPKDVKYKRINKAKSKSLEELRGRLRNWVDKGNRHIPNLEQSQSYA
ncbi:uncharacterized protein LOC113370435 [Ctenocephalides felis]|uniref:uncharacterized protein LOC113370435 n=1 Tax=Ctenocephalides felis TaxID=7515 RepID=UPI000E6E3E07|nr:uncharacterized protein LOC113370435 [Ctenocephalides felis]